MTSTATRAPGGLRQPGAATLGAEKLAGAFGAAVLGLAIIAVSVDPDATGLPIYLAMSDAGRSAGGAAGGSGSDTEAAGAGGLVAGGYLGITHTHPSNVVVKNGDRTDMTVRDVNWIGMPFKSPIYYGIRAIRWGDSGRAGVMLDFTHAKAISSFDQVTAFSGTREGKPVPEKGRIGDTFKHLEFSHGHNMVTLNGMLRLGQFPIQPYVGAGAGVSLPHTEIGYRDEQGRTYEYQYAGLTGQVLAGLEFRVGRASFFLEYKLSYSPYDVPLSGVVQGGWLFGDLWRQISAWAKGEKPPGGRLSTPLLTHHAIGGVLVQGGGAGR
jgi:lipid A oxidase